MTVGVVVIGRNEGERLERCLASAVACGGPVVYVDSGSTDTSLSVARGAGVAVVELDDSVPFCAARARNCGFHRLVEIEPALRHVQFVDGDCEIVASWPAMAEQSLRDHPEVALVAGRMKERFPQQSIYNRLGEFEWNLAVAGEVDAVGGIFMMRREPFEAVGGFDPSIVAGEESELCQRLRRKGWRLLRQDCDMAWHDLAMTRFGEWWTRQVRNGYGSADVARRFGVARFRKGNIRAWVWGMWPPACVVGIVAAACLGSATGVLAAAATFAIWPVQMLRIAMKTWRRTGLPLASHGYAAFLMLAHWPHLLGQMKYRRDVSGARRFRLIEYKSARSDLRSAG